MQSTPMIFARQLSRCTLASSLAPARRAPQERARRKISQNEYVLYSEKCSCCLQLTSESLSTPGYLQPEPVLEGYLRFLQESKIVFEFYEKTIAGSSDPQRATLLPWFDFSAFKLQHRTQTCFPVGFARLTAAYFPQGPCEEPHAWCD